MSRILAITNASKAAIGVLVNSIFAMLLGLGVLEPDVVALILGVVNAVGGVFLTLTYDLSAKRIPDGSVAVEVPPPA